MPSVNIHVNPAESWSRIAELDDLTARERVLLLPLTRKYSAIRRRGLDI
jgi:hypothetical protein